MSRSARPVVVHAQITFENGRDRYSDFVVNGTPIQKQAIDEIDGISLVTAGGFGDQLVDLFRAPAIAAFKLRGDETLGTAAVTVYTFSVTENQNWTLSIRDSNTVTTIAYPSYEGELYVDRATGHPRRIVVRLTHLAKSSEIKSAALETNFDDTPISELGVFSLPANSEATACVQARRKGSSAGSQTKRCIRNAMWFHDCHKFASRARILQVEPQ